MARLLEGLLAWIVVSLVVGAVLGAAFRVLSTQDPAPEPIDDRARTRAPEVDRLARGPVPEGEKADEKRAADLHAAPDERALKDASLRSVQ